MTTPIPQPLSLPFVGNLTSLDKELPVRGFLLLAQQYGEIYKLDILGATTVHANTYALLNELSDDKHFHKAINGPLKQVRNLVGDGLFTAYGEEPNWALAHRLLMPAFGPASIRGMLEDMRDICDQMVLRWERFGSENIIDPTDDFTRVALDTLAYCTMSYRMNSFYFEQPPTFARAMADVLKESFNRFSRPTIVQSLLKGTTAKYFDDIKVMTDIANQMIVDRKAHPTEKKDLLNIMLNARDPTTGEGLSDESISRNLLTFLIAGHETSSGTLAFVVYYLLKNPEALRKLRAEIDEVVGEGPVQYEHLSKLPYLTAVMRETLRMAPTAPTRTVAPFEDTIIGGKYAIKAEQLVTLQIIAIHRDPLVWGEDAAEWKPERMMDGKFEALPPNAWQPFGFGLRGCIGRPFAWQEIQLVLVSIFQRFDIFMADPSYTLELKQALTIKPKDFYIKAIPRNRPRLYSTPTPSVTLQTHQTTGQTTDKVIDNSKRLYVLYGSNTGTCESFAQRVVDDAPSHGYKPYIGSLDSATNNLPTDGPVLIITASFEGQPADNAKQFVDWLSNLQSQELQGVKYAVFGCGNHDWVQTYQRIPALCDDLLEKRGGRRLVPRGAGDAGLAEFFQVFDEFEASLWEGLATEYGTTQGAVSPSEFTVKVLDSVKERPARLRQGDAALGRVIENRVLTKDGVPVKRHIEFELPEGITFRSGDYLAILPRNPTVIVKRALKYFGLTEEEEVVVSASGPTSLPTDSPILLSEIFSGYLELSQPATTRDIQVLSAATEDAATKATLNELLASYAETVLGARISVLDLLETNPSIKLPLGSFIHMLPPMRMRQYSIASSPLVNPQHVALAISVLTAPSHFDKDRPFFGVASNYLANLTPGEKVHMSVRPSAVAFHPPVDPSIPIIMFCAGSGLAPMRGFLQERAAQKEASRDVGPALLFFGCRSDADYIYSDDDLARWIKEGVVDVRPAFSRDSEKSNGCKYVQDRVWHDREDVVKLYRQGAKMFTCGSGAMSKGIKSRLIAIIQEVDAGSDELKATEKFTQIMEGRYATDIFD
ncbi:hypothetical protein EYR38_007278 [Pleurotus pulmonarius]|nr:hypothetical protein EYR38_007278 [Pleurotus pulmonarius]